MAISYLTPEGYENLKNELEHLKTKGREEVAKLLLLRPETRVISLKMLSTMQQKMLRGTWN